jgi:hypothetical protein
MAAEHDKASAQCKASAQLQLLPTIMVHDYHIMNKFP